jgi:hypothetical protein
LIHISFYQVRFGVYFPEGKATRYKAHNKPPVNAKIKNEWSHASAPPLVIMMCVQTALNSHFFPDLILSFHSRKPSPLVTPKVKVILQ